MRTISPRENQALKLSRNISTLSAITLLIEEYSLEGLKEGSSTF
jgi:hypothetical protein